MTKIAVSVLLILVATALIGCAEPEGFARFEVTGLEVTATTVNPGEPTTVRVAVKNTGDARGSYKIELKVNDKVYETRRILLDPGQAINESFTISFAKEGTYEVSADGRKAVIEVRANRLVKLAKAQLAELLGISPSQIEVQSVEATEFRDASLGVPEPGKVYAQVITPGYVIKLVVGGTVYQYHGGGGRVVLVPNQ